MGILCWSPRDFWDASVKDACLAMEGWKQANGVEDKDTITFEDEVALKRMMAAEIRKEKREQAKAGLQE